MSLISTSDIRIWTATPDGDTKPNARFAAIASAVQAFADNYTNRRLEAQVYRTDPYFSYCDGRGKRFIYAPQYPVSYVSEVNIDGDRVFGSGTIIDPSNYFYYPTGKIESIGPYFSPNNCGGMFWKGKRTVRLDYIAGFAPVSGGTWNMAISTYPIPADLKQVMVEMAVQSIKEGITAVHTVQGQQGAPSRFMQMLGGSSFWRMTLEAYKAYDAQFTYDEEDAGGYGYHGGFGGWR